MPVYKCKMCGGSLEISAGSSVCRCSYCDTDQTVPDLGDEERSRLYDRADYYRRSCEFDRAESVYENILAEAPHEAEARWGLCLCRYGVDYVKDPRSGKMVATCRRTRYDSILESADYLAALRYSDGAAASIYRREAAYIDSVQKRILAISGAESPYDVFICYKETEASGERSAASVAAQELYDELTAKGFKTFFARVSLEDKLGEEYEPYIFAALQSAPVMLAVGTKPEHFSSPWVRNEWSRFLAFSSQGQKKYLIPCYRDMNPYDLPEELASLQAQDMSKLGASQDIVRGVEKLIGGGRRGETSAGGASLAERGFLFLEDKEWKNAAAYFEKALDADPRRAEAYLGKLLARLRLPTREALAEYDKPVGDSDEFKKALRFADAPLKEELENGERRRLLNRASAAIENARYPSELERSIAELEALGDRDDARTLADKARVKLKELREDSYRRAEKLVNDGETGADIVDGLRLLSEAGDVYGAAELREKGEGKLARAYENAVAAMNAGDFAEAERLFKRLGSYEDSVALGLKCSREIKRAENARLEAEERAERERAEAEAIERNRARAELDKKQRSSYATGTVVVIAIMIAAMAVVVSCVKTANQFEGVLAQPYRVKMLTASPILSACFVYLDSRKAARSGSSNLTVGFGGFVFMFITCYFMHRSGGDALYLLFTAGLHIGAMFLAGFLGGKARRYYSR